MVKWKNNITDTMNFWVRGALLYSRNQDFQNITYKHFQYEIPMSNFHLIAMPKNFVFVILVN